MAKYTIKAGEMLPPVGNRSYVVVLDLLPEVIRELHKIGVEMTEQLAQDIVDDFGGTCAIDTGFMASSGYIETKTKGTYAAHTDGARPLLPEVEKPTSDQEAIAAIGATYAFYVEHGTRKMAAQPAFYPAVDRAYARMSEEFGEWEAKIAAKLRAASIAARA